MSTPTTRLRLELQALGSGLNTWGVQGLNGIFNVLDESLGGVKEITLTGNHTLTTTNYSSNESRFRNIKFIGSPGSAPTITIPATENWYLIENACGQTITISNSVTTGTLANGVVGYVRTNGGSTLSILPLLDQTNGKIVADNIGSVNTVAGQITPANNIATLAGINADITTVANAAYKALVEVVGESAYKALVEVVGEAGYKAFVETVGASAYKALVEVVGNAAYKSLVEVVGETNYKTVVEVVGNAAYKAFVEVVGESAYKTKVEVVADATYKGQIEALNDATYKSQLQSIATSPYKPLVETVGNAAYKSLVEVVGEANYKLLVETVGASAYKALVEVVGESVYKGKVEIVANNQPAISNVSSKINDVNNFNDLYQIAASAPSTDGGGNALSQGDLFYDTAANELKIFNGTAFQGGVTATGNLLAKSSNLSDLASVSQARTNLGGVITEISQDTSPQLGADLDMQNHSISSGILGIKNTGSQSELRLYCETGNAHFTSIKSAPHSAYSGNLTLQLPGSVGAAGQVLTDVAGNGVLAWSTPAGGGIATQMKFA